jgi:glycosyltransferase involved in cell wall biosynthesis
MSRPAVRVDYVSPLPPVRSGIADYSRDLLPHLAASVDLRVLRLPDQPVAEEVIARWAPVPAVEAGTEGRLPLYQMGNNPYHEAIWDLAWERPGVLTLHDLVLHHLVAHRTLGRRDFEAYRRQLLADHGWIGAAACGPRRYGLEEEAALFGLPACRSLLRRQRGVLVHNRWAAARIAEDDPEIEVRAVPMGIPPRAAAAGRRLREALGIPAGRLLLGSFGFQTPGKRTAAVIAALAQPCLAGVHLLIVGEVSPVLDFERLAREAGVADRVHVTGFVPYADFEAALVATDLCVNLRYPTAGETSASLLRVLASGRPALVSDYAQFAELPEAAAVRVPLGAGEAEALAARVAELAADAARLAALGASARDYVRREHDPARAAEAIAAACAEWAERRPPGEAAVQVPAPTSLTWRELPGRLEVRGAEPPWGEGRRRRLTVRAENRGPARWLAAERGPGGMALEARLIAACPEPPRPWIPLTRDVPPGGEGCFSFELRRPPGPLRLALALKVVDAPEALAPRLELPL